MFRPGWPGICVQGAWLDPKVQSSTGGLAGFLSQRQFRLVHDLLEGETGLNIGYPLNARELLCQETLVARVLVQIGLSER